MSDDVSRLVERRILMRAAIDTLAEPLTGDARDQFLADAEVRISSSLPAPGKTQMRNYLRAVRSE